MARNKRTQRPVRKSASNVNLTALRKSEIQIVEAAAARIFPTTETPGAREAGVIHYIDRTLKEHYPGQINDYRRGCAGIERHAQKLFGNSFVKLTSDQQDVVLGAFDKNAVPGFKEAKDFFSLLRKHTMEGMFCEPLYGGNHNLVGWRLVGFPGQQFEYSDPYINRVADLEPVSLDRPFVKQEAINGGRR